MDKEEKLEGEGYTQGGSTHGEGPRDTPQRDAHKGDIHTRKGYTGGLHTCEGYIRGRNTPERDTNKHTVTQGKNIHRGGIQRMDRSEMNTHKVRIHTGEE